MHDQDGGVADGGPGRIAGAIPDPAHARLLAMVQAQERARRN